MQQKYLIVLLALCCSLTMSSPAISSSIEGCRVAPIHFDFGLNFEGLNYKCLLEVKGQGTRQYWLFMPRAYFPPDTGWPVVIDLHGGGGLDPSNIHQTVSGFARLAASSKEFIVVTPIGAGRNILGVGLEWTTCDYNDRENCPNRAVGDPQLSANLTNDLDYLIEVIEDIKGRKGLKVDINRIYATGLSSGAAMVNALLCDPYGSSLLAAAAPFSTGPFAEGYPRNRDNYDMRKNCASTHTVPQLYAHSPTDTITDPAFGLIAVEFWLGQMNCNPGPSHVDSFDYDGDDESTVCETYTGCDQEAELISCSAETSSGGPFGDFGGHIIYATDDFRNPFFLLRTPAKKDAPGLAEYTWDFFKRFTHR